jgi:stage II sporulation protein D
LAVSSNNNPIEYHKALAIAARTYAQYNINIGGKHPAGYFHLNASAYDQVYRGYNSEIRLPNFVKAVEETRGLAVVYNGDIVVTPYFSQSDGRTRAWEEVWFGSGKPWLVSRPDPNCAGMSLFGHGVGLSARGARGMALAGSTSEQILKHYYAGVGLKTIY